MNPTFDAFLRSWPFEPWLSYVASADGRHLPARLAGASSPRSGVAGPLASSSLSWPGLTMLFLALASPIEPFTSLLLQVHMLQHLSADDGRRRRCSGWALRCFPCCWDCRDPIRTTGLAPLFRSSVSCVEHFSRSTHPVPAWLLFAAATWFWHLPAIYELALRSDGLALSCSTSVSSATALLFWYPVIRPYPEPADAGRPGCWSLT